MFKCENETKNTFAKNEQIIVIWVIEIDRLKWWMHAYYSQIPLFVKSSKGRKKFVFAGEKTSKIEIKFVQYFAFCISQIKF